MNNLDELKGLKRISEVSFGMLFSRQSGKQKFIEIELLFDPGISLEKIKQIEQNMSSRIIQDIPDVRFRLIPKVLTSGAGC